FIVGRPLTNGPNHGGANYRIVSPCYFDIYKIPLIQGRLLNERDIGAAAGVVVINQALARQYWPKGDPLSDRIVVGKAVGPEFNEPERQIIGIVGDVRDGGLNRDPRPTMYIPVAQVPDGITALNSRIVPITWIIRTRSSPGALGSQIEKELREASG